MADHDAEVTLWLTAEQSCDGDAIGRLGPDRR
jgi:hypothetical protein